MPGLPQHPQLPPEPKGDTPTDKWGVAFQRAFHHLWTAALYVVNALVKADTLANRPTTPDLDEILYYETNSKALSVGSAGAWVQVGPRRGSVTVLSGATTAAVTLTPNEADTGYRVVFGANFNNGGIWLTSRATTGFTVNVATAAPVGNGTVDYLTLRD